MRDRFSELIQQGVASFQEKNVGASTPTLDPLVKAYNNLWGVLTDTHMSKVEDGYIITGTFVKSPYWDRFKYCGNWGTTNIKLGSGFYSLEAMISTYGYMMTPEEYNGDYVIKLVQRPADANPGIPGECNACCPCSTDVPCCISLGESQIPHPFKEFFTPKQIDAIKEAWEAGNGDAMKVVENLKSSKEINNEFRISADNQYIIVDEKLKIKL